MYRGMTGTRSPNDYLVHCAEKWLSVMNPECDTVVTGGCIGMDAIVGQMASNFGLNVHVVLPSDHKQVDQSWFTYATSHVQMAPRTTYRDRNIKIVETSDSLAVFAQYPEDDERSKRSGTWMTYRIAVARKVPIRVYIDQDQES